jgi:SNF2 family DNA or RNA helicase
MVRHRRSEVALRLPQRLAETVLVPPDSDERALYEEMVERVRVHARDATPARRMALRSVSRLAGSTPAAAAPTLAKLGWTDLAVRAAAITDPAKVRLLMSKLAEHTANGEKVLVFTAFRRTLDTVAASARAAGIDATVYDGGLSRAEKEAVIGAFRHDVPVLLSTESAGEGRNLQFCHVMINLDLPWNPMQIEQRLGRLHRVGQTHDVLLTNLVSKGSIEERILHVLETKINMFELVVGELDMILGRIDDDFDFERAVFEAFANADDDRAFVRRMDEIGADLVAARDTYLRSRLGVDALVGDEQ